MFKLLALPWVLIAIWVISWSFRWSDHTTARATGDILNGVEWYLDDGGRCGYIYSTGDLDANTLKANMNGPWQAVVEYRWPVPSDVFSTEQKAIDYVERACRGSNYSY